MCDGSRTWTWAVGVLGATLLGAAIAEAQPAASRLEVGGQLHVLRLSDADETAVGIGGRVTFDVTRWWSVEGEYQWLPSDTLTTRTMVADGGALGIDYQRRRSTILAGAKAGYRGTRLGVFGKLRPGVTRLSDRGVECRGDACALVLLAVPDYRPEFALDVGGVLEFYPSSRWTARLDVSDLVIRHRSAAPPCVAGSCTSHNLAVSAGVGVRF